MNQSSAHHPDHEPELQPVKFFNVPAPTGKNRVREFFSEPYRPFFLLGWTISLIGIALWPLFFLDMVSYPARAHAFLMIQGFFGSFAVGFLWTAFPHMLEVPGPGPIRLAVGLTLIAAGTILHLIGAHLVAHLLFLCLLGLVAQFAAARFPARRDLPPPSFVLVLSGFVLGAVGTLFVALGEAGVELGFFYRLGRLFLLEIFFLFLVMGIAAFLAPRFLKQPSRQSLPDSRTPTPAWKRQAALAGATGAILLVGACLQATGMVRTGALAIAAPLTAYVLYQVPIWRRLKSRDWMADGLRLGLIFALASPWTRLLFPYERIATAHLLLLGGFGLLTWVISTRVSCGHGGFGHLFRTRMKPLGVVVMLYAVSLAIRLTGEVATRFWMPSLVTSALLLLAAHLAWGRFVLPKIFFPKEDDPEPTMPPLRFPAPDPRWTPRS